MCVEISAQVIVHILLELRHLLLSNRRSGDQKDTLLLLRFLLEIYCDYQGDDSEAVVIIIICGATCVCLDNILQYLMFDHKTAAIGYG